MADVHVDNQSGGVKKPRKSRRSRPGKKALKEIKCYQVTEKTLIPVAVMQRAVRHILAKWQPDGARIKPDAFKALHTGVEDYVTTIFKGTQMMAIHANRQTIMKKDLNNLTRICTVMSGAHDLETDPINEGMSERNKRKKRRSRASNSNNPVKETKKRARRSSPKSDVPLPTEAVEEEEVALPIQHEEEVVVEIEVEEEIASPGKEQGYDDEWLLS
jgi:histone H3